MNYITLNGKKSTEIKGLLIQALPPITKPLIRTQIEEIDGRDGDIITKLGYSAYDKELSIGLFGNYNIDDVISFFDSEGTVIFSNEPDKFYYYQIIQQIDFEKLIRFKTATVIMHVQPFKYAAVDKAITYAQKPFVIPDFTTSINGINVSVNDNKVNVVGTITTTTEFYIPIELITLKAGSYDLKAYSEGMMPHMCFMRLIYDAPSSISSFAGTYAELQSDKTVSITEELNEERQYNYLYLYIVGGGSVNFTFNISMIDNNFTGINVLNIGNVAAKPKITIYGKNTINLYLNGKQALVINFGIDEYITIDVTAMEAYKDGILKNRSVTGDYNNLILNIGNNVISWTGDITKITIENFSRWI